MQKIGAQFARGFLMGAADVVPGVSGGTIALVLGIYQKLIDTIREGSRALGTLVKGDVHGFWTRLKELDFLFLVPLLAGTLLILTGMYTATGRAAADLSAMTSPKLGSSINSVSLKAATQTPLPCCEPGE